MKHEDCTHGDGNAWAITPDRRYFKRCDTCNTFRLWEDYREVYFVDVENEGNCWWWECTKCIIKTISDYADVWEVETNAPCPGCGNLITEGENECCGFVDLWKQGEDDD